MKSIIINLLFVFTALLITASAQAKDAKQPDPAQQDKQLYRNGKIIKRPPIITIPQPIQQDLHVTVELAEPPISQTEYKRKLTRPIELKSLIPENAIITTEGRKAQLEERHVVRKRKMVTRNPKTQPIQSITTRKRVIRKGRVRPSLDFISAAKIANEHLVATGYDERHHIRNFYLQWNPEVDTHEYIVTVDPAIMETVKDDQGVERKSAISFAILMDGSVEIIDKYLD